MRFTKIALIVIALFFSCDCYAGTSSPEQTNAAIHTYGGGPLLEKVFNAIAMIFYGDAKTGIGKAFNGIIRLSLTIGGFCAICLAFFKEKFDPLVRSFFLPAVGIVCCLLVPRTSIYIVDHLGQRAPTTAVWGVKKIDNIPFFLGKFTTLVSEISYRIERLFTNRAHDLNDETYNWTGNIYAGENIFRTKKCRIANPTLEDNFREFCRECIFRDLGIGLYTKDQLIHTPDLLKFLGENTSNIRTVLYKADGSKYLPCKEAMKQMNELFNGKQGNTREIILGETGNQINFLLGQKEFGQKELQNLLKQQIAIDILKEEIPGNLNSFAAKRAEILQKENQRILGALGASSIVAMRNFFEAVIYMVFPLIIIISLLSCGLSPLTQWLQFVLWVNTWPVFYIVLNFMLNSIWDVKKKAILTEGPYLTIFSSEGLSDLYSSMESIAAIALAFIPYLAWILLKGGVSQMVHLASSMMSPAQSAASTSAAESTSGNYSFGNVSLDNVNGHNAQMFKQSYSPALSHGSVGIDSGSQSVTFTPHEGGLYLKQGDSHLREGISKTEAFNYSVQDALTKSKSAVFESSKAVSEGITDSTNKGASFVEAISKHWQTGENVNTQEMSSGQESFQYIKNISDEYALSKGISKDAALREVLSAGIGGSFGRVEGSMQNGVSQSSSEAFSERLGESDGLQKHLQTMASLSTGEVASLLGSEDVKLHQDFAQSFNKTDSSLGQWRAAHSKHEALSKVQSYASSDNLSFHQNLNQRFVDFLSDKFQGDISKVIGVTEMHNSHADKKGLIQEFTTEFLPKKIQESDMKDTYQQYENKLPASPSDEKYAQKKSDFMDNHQPKIGHDFNDIRQDFSHMKSRVQAGKDDMNQDLNNQYDLMMPKEEQVKANVNPEQSIMNSATDQLFLGKAIKLAGQGAKSTGQAAKSTGQAMYNALFTIGENVGKGD